MTERKRVIKVRGKNVTFSSREVKGEARFFRDGKPATSRYQKRVAKGVLEGKTLAEARGHPWGAYESKRLTRNEIEAQEEFSLGSWAEPPTKNARAQDRATYYAKVSVTSESVKRVNSPTGEEEACQPMTLVLRDPDTNEQRGFTLKELLKKLERVILFTVDSYGLTLCTGDPKADTINVWRHSRK